MQIIQKSLMFVFGIHFGISFGVSVTNDLGILKIMHIKIISYKKNWSHLCKTLFSRSQKVPSCLVPPQTMDMARFPEDTSKGKGSY